MRLRADNSTLFLPLVAFVPAILAGCSSDATDADGSVGGTTGAPSATTSGSTTGSNTTGGNTTGGNTTGSSTTSGVTTSGSTTSGVTTSGSTTSGGLGSTTGAGGAGTSGFTSTSGQGGSTTGTDGAGGQGTTGGTGGGSGTAKWGEEEDPSAFCTVTDQFPGYNELTADGNLPDPFTMMDGTRITDKSQWACRREELLKQQFNYVYGDKPIPAEGSVSGSVSTSQISVQVSEGGKSTSFNVTVDMNGATAPAPAIICYDGGLGCSLPVPSGVAKLNFKAIEGSGGSGPKTGPFFDFYGSDHPAGYMVAQAWQISRIIDLLEQDPSVIDPYHIGLTGCSRNGKGAFAGGALDNRVALTIPCESGMGGTVGLRLKEQLDPGANDTAEWPYHAISYVRWLSEVALGPFATSNDANGDNTDKLPVDMHEMMALVAPRAIYIVDNPSITNLDPKSAYVTGMAGKAIFEALGVGDHFAYQGAGGSHCQWRSQYTAPLNAMIDRFLLGKDSTQTGSFETDLGSKPNATQYYTWDTSELSGDL